MSCVNLPAFLWKEKRQSGFDDFPQANAMRSEIDDATKLLDQETLPVHYAAMRKIMDGGSV